MVKNSKYLITDIDEKPVFNANWRFWSKKGCFEISGEPVGDSGLMKK